MKFYYNYKWINVLKRLEMHVNLTGHGQLNMLDIAGFTTSLTSNTGTVVSYSNKTCKINYTE